jgi:hypothetical protein
LIHRFELAPLDKTARLFSILPMIALAVCSFGLLWLIPFLFSPRDYRRAGQRKIKDTHVAIAI